MYGETRTREFCDGAGELIIIQLYFSKYFVNSRIHFYKEQNNLYENSYCFYGFGNSPCKSYPCYGLQEKK